ncbi:hypothetical protein TNCV_84231 [Trichonephila clavipes]|nr:hypothetical protein TNCV_84231 [Trichonephila clavipes]
MKVQTPKHWKSDPNHVFSVSSDGSVGSKNERGFPLIGSNRGHPVSGFPPVTMPPPLMHLGCIQWNRTETRSHLHRLRGEVSVSNEGLQMDKKVLIVFENSLKAAARLEMSHLEEKK